LRSSHLLTPALWEQSVITTPETPLLIAGENNNRRIAALSFDLHDSDLPLQPSFPILIYNLVNWFLPPSIAGDGQVSPGMPVTVQTWPGADQVTIVDPHQQHITVAPPFPAIPFAQTNTTGIYQVMQQVHGQEKRGAFTVNLFDPLQSRLAPANELPVAHSTDFSTGNNSVPQVLREIWPWIAAFLLLVLCVEWWLFSRSYRPQSTAATQNKGKSAYSRMSSKSQQGKQSGTIGVLQDELAIRYRTLLKRISKLTKRIKSNRTRRKSKGNSDVNV